METLTGALWLFADVLAIVGRDAPKAIVFAVLGGLALVVLFNPGMLGADLARWTYALKALLLLTAVPLVAFVAIALANCPRFARNLAQSGVSLKTYGASSSIERANLRRASRE